ncbi:MAG: hypothetical protein HOO91_20640 [Bacteroidales bacterium]|nr:hypothetical protein [Bacteroidales bacterium]
MSLIRIFLSSVLLTLIVYNTKCQTVNDVSFNQIEDSIKVLMGHIIKDNSFSKKEEANNNVLSLFRNSLIKEGAFSYPFDSLKNIGRITSKDGKLRIFTWNLPLTGGCQRYFGFIMYKKSKGNMFIFELNDSRQTINAPIKELLGDSNWMGALYYSLIEKIYKGKTYYVLLGFDFNNIFSSKKIIEVLTFGKDYKPVFGSNVFKVGDNVLSRVVFEYSARVTMTLRYVPESQTIVFDHLSPSSPEYADNYQFYGPDFTFDGFKYQKGFWIYVRNLDMRNSSRGPGKHYESPEKLPEPGFLYKTKSGLPMQKQE